MLDKTRDKIINIFRENHGYMSYEALKNEGVTVIQMRDLEGDDTIERFARGWYWCKVCGYEKPADHKYIEVSLVDPEAVICLDSACFLAGIPVSEPENIKFAVPRSDRKKYELDFPVKRYFYTHMEDEYIVTRNTEYGNYRFFAPGRALFECLSRQNKVDDNNLETILKFGRTRAESVERYKSYLGNIKQTERQMRKETKETGGLYER